MTKANFTEMTRKELKTYIRQNPTDDEAIRELFVHRRSPNAKNYPYESEKFYYDSITFCYNYCQFT